MTWGDEEKDTFQGSRAEEDTGLPRVVVAGKECREKEQGCKRLSERAIWVDSTSKLGLGIKVFLSLLLSYTSPQTVHASPYFLLPQKSNKNKTVITSYLGVSKPVRS